MNFFISVRNIILNREEIGATFGIVSSPEGYKLNLYANQNGVIPIGKKTLISFGISAEFPKGIYGKIFLREFLRKNRIKIKNAEFGADVISSANTDIIKLCMLNDGNDHFNFKIGQFMAEMIFKKLEETNGDSNFTFYLTTKYNE